MSDLHAAHQNLPLSIRTLRVRETIQNLHQKRTKCKTTELIEMPFEMLTRVGPRNHVLDGGSDPQERGNFGGEVATHGN